MPPHDWKEEPWETRYVSRGIPQPVHLPKWICSRCGCSVFSARMPVSLWVEAESRVALAYYDATMNERVLRGGQTSGDCDDALVHKVMDS